MAVGRGEYLIDIKLLDTGVEARINGVVVSLRDVDKQIKNIRTSSSGASTGLNKISNAAKGTTKANQDLISSSGLAGATLVETGRFISDLPFGITAVTNNLSQLSTLFITLASKTEESGGAFKALGKQLKGPLGFILIFQVVISLIQVYQKEILGFIKGTKGANEATKELTKSVDDLSEKLKENNKDFKDREKAEKILNKLRDTALEYENRSLQAQKGIESAQNARITRLKELGVEVDKTRILEEGYIDTLLTSVKTSKEVSQELEDRRIKIETDRILGIVSPVELAQRQFDLFIATQEELNVKKEDYIKSEEYRKLQAKLFKAELDARKVTVAGVLKERGLQGLGVLFSLEETELQKEARKELKLGEKDRAKETTDFLEGEQKRLNSLVKTDTIKKKLSDADRSRRNEDLRALASHLDAGAALFGEQTVANKGMRVASATMDTYAAADTALATLPPPFSFIAAAATIAAGLANVKNILSVKVPGGKGGAGSVPSTATAGRTIEAPDFNVVGATAQSQLAETIAGAESQPIRAYVVGKDITTQQELDRNRQRTSSLG